MADGGRNTNGASLAGTVCVLFILLVFPGACLSGPAGMPGAVPSLDANAGGGIPQHSLEEAGHRRRTPVSPASSTSMGRRPQQQQAAGRARHGAVRQQDQAAISRLSKVFGIDRVPIHRHHRSPPQYMVELYSAVAYRNGITRTQSPYGSDVVRGFPDRASRDTMVFHFNVSYIEQSEKVLQGELHVFRLRPRPPQGGSRIPRGVHLVELRLYQILDPRALHQDEALKLLDFRRVSTQTHGWEVFKVKSTVQEWVNDSTKNHGFLVAATTLGGAQPVNGSYLRIAQRAQHHDSKQPVLVVFTEDHRRHAVLDDAGSDVLPADERRLGGGRTSSTQSVQHRTYVQFLNERHRAKHGNYRIFPRSSKTFLHQQDADQGGGSSDLDPDSRSSTRSSRNRRAVEFYNTPRKRKETCSRHELYVDFDEIGWSGWIISPKGYNAYHCKGECPFPLGQNQKPTNHATVQSIVHALRIGKGVGTPCCVPNKLYSFSLLYFDDDENVILKRYDDMVAASCGCH